MKKIIFIILLFMPIIGNGQTYFHFPDSMAIWREYYVDNDEDNHYQYGIIGDTVINSILYHKVYYESDCLSDTVLTTDNSFLVGGIREDSLKGVYFYSFNYQPNGAWFIHTDSIYKLYDFSLQIGDTVKFQSPLSLPVYAFPYLVLDSVDSVFVYDHFRKRYHLQGDIWIEGIGSTRSLFSSIIRLPACYCVWKNVCFEFNNLTYYVNPPYHDCYDMSYDIKEDEQTDGKINVFPNPIISSSTIDLSDLNFQPEVLEVFNMLGEKIREYIVPENKKKINIDRRDYPSGLYFFRLTASDQRILNGRFMVE